MNALNEKEKAIIEYILTHGKVHWKDLEQGLVEAKVMAKGTLDKYFNSLKAPKTHSGNYCNGFTTST